MKAYPLLLAFVFAGMRALPAAAQPEIGTEGAAEVHALVDAWIEAWNAQKIVVLSGLLLPDAVVIQPGEELLGVPAIVEGWVTPRLDTRMTEVEPTLSLLGETTALQSGHATLTGPAGGAMPDTERIQYTFVWAHDVNEDWRLQLIQIAPEAPAPDAGVRDAIARTNEAFAQAWARGDAAGVAGLYTEDARLFAPGQEPQEGRAAIEAFVRSSLDAGLTGIHLESLELTTYGDTAREVGRYTLRTDDGREAGQGWYLVIWKQEDGQWHLHRDVVGG